MGQAGAVIGMVARSSRTADCSSPRRSRSPRVTWTRGRITLDAADIVPLTFLGLANLTMLSVAWCLLIAVAVCVVLVPLSVWRAGRVPSRLT